MRMWHRSIAPTKTRWAAQIRRRPNLEMIESRLAPAAIVGSVFIDANGNGIRENTEPGQSNVIVFVDLNNDGKLTPGTPGTIGEPFTKSNLDGKYALQVAPGTYNIRQVVPTGFVQTTKTPDPVVVSPNVTIVDGPVFGNKLEQPPPTQGGVINGRVYVDADGNGQQGSNEFGQPNVTVFIDLNNNGMFDPPNSGTVGEPATQTGLNGNYELKVGVNGEYQVLEVVPQGFTMTTPIPGKVAVANGAIVSGPHFGNQLLPPPPPQGGLIQGKVFIDADGNGQQDPMEVGQGGVRVFLDLNADGKWSSVGGTITVMEPSVLSAIDGTYNLKVPADGEYQVLEVVPQGYQLTTPTPGKVAVVGGAMVQGPTFGNQLLPPPPPQGGVVSGRVFIDADGDATLDANEVGQGGVLVFVDLNNNGKFDPATNTGTPGDLARLTNADGFYEFKLAKDGEYQLLEVVPAGYTMTTPTPGKIMVAGGAAVTGPLFGNQLLPPPPMQGGVVRGHVFVDFNGNGTRENNEPGQGGVIVFADLNNDGQFNAPTPTTIGEPATKTNQEGKYELKLNADGAYSVLEVVPQGFKMTTPPPAKVQVSGGAAVSGPTFGNQPIVISLPGAAAGRVFFDANNNSKLDFGEPGMPFVRVYDDANNNNQFDQGERTTFSGFNGRYILALSPGMHNLRQVVPNGFVQSLAPGTVTIVSGQIAAGNNFGNAKTPPLVPIVPFNVNEGISTTLTWTNGENVEQMPTLNGVYVGMVP